jgi:hypothetical protein
MHTQGGVYGGVVDLFWARGSSIPMDITVDFLFFAGA